MFKDLDVYKIILLASVLLVPGAWGYAWYKDGQVEDAKKALRLAVNSSNGPLDRIGELLTELDTVQQNADRGQETDAKIFFQNQLIKSDTNLSISPNDFQIDETVPGSRGRGGKKTKDIDVDIKFLDKDFKLSRGYLHALLYNCEALGLQIWKLRRLTIENAALKELKKGDPVPETVADDWLLRKLTFSRRVPNN